MNPHFSSIIIYSSIQLVAFAVILTLNKRYYVKANKILALFLFLTGIALFLYALLGFEYFYHFPPIVYTLGFLGIPILLFYVKTYLTNNYQFKKNHLWHLLPFFIQFLFWLFVILHDTSDPKILEFYLVQRDLSFALVSAFYIFQIIKEIKLYHNLAKEEYSYTNENILKWFYALILIIIVCPIIVMVLLRLSQDNEAFFNPLMFSIFTFLILLIILMRPEIYQGIGVIAPINQNHNSPLRNQLTLDQKKSLFNQLINYIEDNESYLNPELKLSVLADILDTNVNYLSQSINSISNGSFRDLINTYRIEHSKKMLTDPLYSKFTIDGIANKVGFKSKSAFYNAFKNQNSISPLAFKNQNTN